MRKLLIVSLLLSFAANAHAYSIKHSYSGENNSIEYYGACDDGEMLKVTEHGDGRYSYEGPAGGGIVNGSLDKAAAAACGE